MNYRFLNRYTVLGAIVLAVYGIIANEGVFGGIFGGILQAVTSNKELYPLGVVPEAMLVLAIHKRWFYPEFEGNLQDGKPALGFRLGLLILIACVMLPLNMLRHPESFGPPTHANRLIKVCPSHSSRRTANGIDKPMTGFYSLTSRF